jgi:hypothetical protein
LEVLCSHLGYDDDEVMPILVRSMSNAPVTLKLIEVSSGRTVAVQKGKPLGRQKIPSRYYFRANFERVTRSGRYILEATQLDQTARSVEFSVRPDSYAALARQIQAGISTQRMNTEVPGVHEVDWLDGSIMPAANGRFDKQFKIDQRVPSKNRMGGWYDASDWSRFNNQQIPAIFGLLNQAMFIPSLAQSALDESAWGLKGLLRVQREDGTFWQHIRYYPPDDGIPCSGDRIWAAWNQSLPQAAGVLAMAAYTYRTHDSKLAAECLEAGQRSYRRIVQDWENRCRDLEERNKIFAGLGEKPFNRLLFAPKALWAALYLWKATDQQTYRDDIDRHLNSLLIALREKAYLSAEYAFVGHNHRQTTIEHDFLWTPLLLLKEIPDYPRKHMVEHALITAFSEIKRLCRQNPFGMLPALAPGTAPEYAKANLGSYWSCAAYAMALGAKQLNDPSLRGLANNQMHWLLGRNVQNLSMVGGVGRRFQQRATAMQRSSQNSFGPIKKRAMG